MIAQVIVNHNTKRIDKPLDYGIPEGMELSVGSCVMVPFGAKDRPYEAYVVALKQTTDAKRLKYVLEALPKGRVFDENMLELILWMRERYLCSYIDVIHAIAPAGTARKSTEYLCLGENRPSSGAKAQEAVCRVLAENGNCMEKSALFARFDHDISGIVRKMTAEGILRREFEVNQTVSDKMVRTASLAVTSEEAVEAAEKLMKKAPVQARILEILSVNDRVSVADLKAFSGSSGNAVNVLEKKGLITLQDVEVYRDPVNRYVKPDEDHVLTGEQETVLEKLEAALDQKEYEGFLLYGVTGSGKTEVFMRAIDHTLRQGRQAVVLVPEISLTPQTVNRFTARFGERVAVFHSGLSMGEKYDQWKKMRDGKADIVIGARSAVFAPFSNVGMIILDEEHSDSYKSEMMPRYQTREVAQFRMRQLGGVLLLASATPGVDSYYRAQRGEYTLLSMEKRFNEKQMPPIYLADMREELERGNKSMFSLALQEEIKKNLERGEQTILFLNRRGFSTFVSCRSCGFVAECPNCNISLTYHKFDNTLQCHYCGHTIENYVVCPECGSNYIRYFGGGTQRVEEEIKRLFPQATTIRMDVDTTGKKQSHQTLLSKFEKQKIDILIGTQMVAKGLDFENVTLVGVVSADTMLHIDDYRSAERTFGVLEQVTGRAGRGDKPGRAVVQTYNPDHQAVQLARAHDYRGFYETEIELRKMMWYPPFCDIVSVQFSGGTSGVVQRCAKHFVKQLRPAKERREQTQILGPIPSAVSKIKNKYRWQLLIKCGSGDSMNTELAEAKRICGENESFQDISIVIDKNPNSVY